MERFKRVFVVVMDSLGVGAMPDSADFGDIGVNTLGHISQSVDTFKIPNLQKLGMANIIPLKQVPANEHPIGYYGKLRETSRGKDTMTGHWEMMGLEVTKPFKTFTETGFPPELIEELEKRTGMTITISEYDFMGGMRAVIRGRNILIDHSFQAAVDYEYHQFSFAAGGAGIE